MDPGVSLNNCTTVTIVGSKGREKEVLAGDTGKDFRSCSRNVVPKFKSLDLVLLEWDVVWMDSPELGMRI